MFQLLEVDINLNDVVYNGRINEKYNLINSRNEILHVEIRWKVIWDMQPTLYSSLRLHNTLKKWDLRYFQINQGKINSFFGCKIIALLKQHSGNLTNTSVHAKDAHLI